MVALGKSHAFGDDLGAISIAIANPVTKYILKTFFLYYLKPVSNQECSFKVFLKGDSILTVNVVVKMTKSLTTGISNQASQLQNGRSYVGRY